MTKLTWKIGGEAGFGIMVSGLAVSKVAMRSGYHVFEGNEYPSLIRGGHNTVTVHISSEEAYVLPETIELLVALNRETVDLHKHELVENGGVIFDGEQFEVKTEDFSKPVKLYSVPLMRLAKELGGDVLMRNTVALGASMAITNLDFSLLGAVLTDQFSKKGEEVVNHNIKTAQAGYDFVKKNSPDEFVYKLGDMGHKGAKKVIVNGADSLGMGMVGAGCKFFSAYPMTPINGLLAYMAAIQTKGNFIYKQPEDEIAAINMAIGASFGGVRSAVATSGGGFSLMTEGLSLAGMLEQPIVIIYGMRPGPATGLPTWTGQADLHFVLNASQGEFPRLVLAPGDVEEAFELTLEAFNLADRCQSPCFILVDKQLNESRKTTDYAFFSQVLAQYKIDRGRLLSAEEQNKTPEIKRYELTADGISPRPIPGRSGGLFRVNSDEHDEWGYSTEEADWTQKMVEKRNKKLDVAAQSVPDPKVYGPENADITLVGWGSTKGAVLDALKLWNEKESSKLSYIHLNWINPFPSAALKNLLDKATFLIDIEANHNAQMRDWILLKTGVKIKNTILKYNGRPFYPEEIVREVKKLVE